MDYSPSDRMCKATDSVLRYGGPLLAAVDAHSRGGVHKNRFMFR